MRDRSRSSLGWALNAAMIGALAVGLVGGLAVFAANAAAAPAKPSKGSARPDTSSETFGAWVLRCGPTGKGCYLYQTLARKKDRARIARATIMAPRKKNGKLKLRVLLPLGIGLAKGSMLSVDKAAPRKVPYLACWRRGCAIELTVPSLLERRLRVGRMLTVTAFAIQGAKPLRFRFSLKGLSRAIRRLRSK